MEFYNNILIFIYFFVIQYTFIFSVEYMIIDIYFNPYKIRNNKLIIEQITKHLHNVNIIKPNINEYNLIINNIINDLNNYECLNYEMEYVQNNIEEDFTNRYYALITIQKDEKKLFSFIEFYIDYKDLTIILICQNIKETQLLTQLLNISKEIIYILHYEKIALLVKNKYMYFFMKKNEFVIADSNTMKYQDDGKKLKPLNLQHKDLQIILAMNPIHIEKNIVIVDKLIQQLHNVNILVDEFNTINKHIIRDIKTDNLCAIFKDEVLNSFKKNYFDGIIIVSGNNNKTYGFATFTFEDYDNEKYIYINFLCSNKSIEITGIGSTIMNVAKYMLRIIDYKIIRLGARAEAVGFYEKQGFIFNDDGLFIKYEPQLLSVKN